MALSDDPPTTSSLGITLPRVLGDRNQWGTILNAAAESMASAVATTNTTFSAIETNLSTAVTNAGTAATNSADAKAIAIKMVNSYLITIANSINTLNTSSAAAASNASTAATDAASAKSTAEGLV